MSSSSSLIPLEQNHELHGALLGVGVGLALKVVGGRSWSESLSIGGVTGTLATAAMKTYGHPTNFSLKGLTIVSK